MKKSALVIALIMVLAPLAFVPSAAAATEDEIEASIDAGIEWLASQQNCDGSWGPSEKPAHTGFALVKLVDRARELGVDPFDPDEYEYAENVIDGFEWLESNKTVQFGVNDSQTNNNGQAIFFSPTGHQTYNTAIALIAFANLNGYDEYNENLVQDMVDWFVDTQYGNGGWAYPAWSSDNSNTGYAVIGLAYAENSGAIIPDSLKTALDSWIDYIQNDQGATDDGWENDPDGGSGYTGPSSWVNCLKTGNLILEMGFVGDTTESQRMEYAVDYLVRHWNDNNTDPGWRIHYQSMYCIMKGLEYMQIEEIDGIDWYDDFATAIVTTQNADGSWSGDPWDYYTDILSTEWALLTLEKATVIKEIPVGFDVKPGSCPNPINIKSNGVQPMAIAGSEEFDVYDIDPATLKIGICINGEFTEFEGVAPLRWEYDDVTENYIPEEGEPCCIVTNPDGITDLSMKYDTQELVEAGLGDYEKNDELCLCIKGTTYDGEQFVGRDCIIIK